MYQSRDNTLTRQDMIDKSYKMLTKEEIQKTLSGTTITAKYFFNNSWYKAMTNSFADGTIEGQNNVASYNKGRWQVNEDDSLSLEWDGSWEDWSAFAYKVGDEIMFFDITTGLWRTTFSLIEAGTLATEI